MPRVEGAKFAVDMVENSTVFRAVNTRLNPNPFPGCELHEYKSDAYWECYHRQLTLTLVRFLPSLISLRLIFFIRPNY